MIVYSLVFSAGMIVGAIVSLRTAKRVVKEGEVHAKKLMDDMHDENMAKMAAQHESSMAVLRSWR